MARHDPPRVRLYRDDEVRDLLPRTTLYPELVEGTVWIRWLVVLAGGGLVYLADGGFSASALVVAAVAAYNAVTHLSRIVGSGAGIPASVPGALDVAAVLFVTAIRGPVDTPAVLFLLFPVLGMTVGYGGAGAFAATTAGALGYAGLVLLSPGGLSATVLASGSAVILLLVVVGAGAGYAVHRYEALVRELLHQSVTDPLTGLFNRRFFTGALERARGLARRQDEDFSLMLLDLKDFKAINDQQGHDVGDRILVRIADHFLRKVRLQDVVARIGGDEFAILLPATDLPGGVASARRVVSHMDETDPILSSVALSVGVAVGRTDEGGAESTYVAADRALLTAKRREGSTIMVAGDGTEPEIRPADEVMNAARA